MVPREAEIVRHQPLVSMWSRYSLKGVVMLHLTNVNLPTIHRFSY
jgi:hypothetical protein